MAYFGKILLFAGIILVVIGAVFVVSSNINIPFLGKLPGDILIQRKNFTFYFPIASCLIVSFILSLIFLLIFKK